MIGFAPPGLDVTTTSVVADPGLMSADPGMMTTAAHTFASASQKLQATGQVSARASAQLSTYWLGKGVQGFDTASTKANAGAGVASDSLARAAGALTTLSAQITEAQSLAKQAIALAEESAQAASALQSAYSASSDQAVAALPAGSTAEQAMAARAPTPGQVAQAAVISADAARATQLMAQANTTARQAWAQAAAAFDGVTAQAPSVQAAVANARAQAAAGAHQGGGSLLGGIGSLLGAVVLPVGSGIADVLSDGGAAAATPEEAAAEESLLSGGIADLTDEGASAAEIATAEEEAAAEITVDGTKVGSQVADDATEAEEAGAADQNGPGEWAARSRGGGSARSWDYQAQVSGMPANADGTIPEYTVNGVDFDGYQDGTLLEAKGPGYENFIDKSTGEFKGWWLNSDSGGQAMLNEADRQLAAAGDTPIEWHVAEPGAAQAIQALLDENGYGAIDVVFEPAG